jgi:transcriptional regulator with XRE-family HTH domain
MLGLIQRQLAEMLRVKGSHVAYLENGRRKPSRALLKRLADVLELNRWQLFLLAQPEAKSLLSSSAAPARPENSAKAWRPKCLHATVGECARLSHFATDVLD